MSGGGGGGGGGSPQVVLVVSEGEGGEGRGAQLEQPPEQLLANVVVPGGREEGAAQSAQPGEGAGPHLG